MSSKDTPSHEDGTTGESHNNWPQTADEGTVVSNMLAIAANYDAYEIITVDNFQSDGPITFGAGTMEHGVAAQFDLPATSVDNIVVVRCGSRSDTGEHVCIASSMHGIEQLPSLAVDGEALPESGKLPNNLHEYLQIEIPMGDVPWL
jgi:hypothetical protein